MTSMQNAEALAQCTGARTVTYDDGRGDVATVGSIGTVERVHVAGLPPSYVVTLTADDARGALAVTLATQADEDAAMARRMADAPGLGQEAGPTMAMRESAAAWKRLATQAMDLGWVALGWTQAARLAPDASDAPWPPLGDALRESAAIGAGRKAPILI